MRRGRPSATAERVALRRAAHQLLDRPPVLDDPLALRIIGAARRTALEADPAAGEHEPWSAPLRAFLAARARLAEDELAAAHARGVRQGVVLGAGLDTFGCRNPYADLRVFEVDHPDTQAWKRARLAEEGIAVPASLVFVPVDFERDTLANALARAGFDAGAPAQFSWLGVSMYLTADAVRGVLALVAARPAGSGIVFDYAVDPAQLTPLQRAAVEAFAHRVARAGEPWQSAFAPDTLAGTLAALGFTRIDDCDGERLNARYFAGRADGLAVGGLARVMVAQR